MWSSHAMTIITVSVSLVCATCGHSFDSKLHDFPKKGGNYTNIGKDGQLKEMSWKDCSSSSDTMKMLSISFDPDPPQKAASLIISTKFELYKEVNDGTVFMNVKYLGYIPVYKDSMSLCDLAIKMEETCPLSTGVHENYFVDTFPDYAFSGQYTGTVKTVDDYKNELACTKIKFTI